MRSMEQRSVRFAMLSRCFSHVVRISATPRISIRRLDADRFAGTRNQVREHGKITRSTGCFEMPFGATQSGLNMPTPGGRFMPTRDTNLKWARSPTAHVR